MIITENETIFNTIIELSGPLLSDLPQMFREDPLHSDYNSEHVLNINPSTPFEKQEENPLKKHPPVAP